jgi:ABC-type branched-subunit amino acid transport system substrate-binding protein
MNAIAAVCTLAIVASLSLGTETPAAETAPGVTLNEIKIGSTFPLSGPASAFANTGKGLVAYVDALNDRGGVNGRKVNLIVLDDAYSPPKAVEQTRKLVEDDEVAFIYSPIGTPSNAATIKYLNAKKVPHLFIVSGASKFSNYKEYPYTTTGLPSYETEGKIYVDYISQNFSAAKIGVLYQNDDLGKDFVNAFRSRLGDSFGAKVVALSYELSDPTIDSQIVNLKSSGAQVLLLAGTPKFTAQAIRKANELSWKPQIIINLVSSSIATTLKPAGLDISTGIISATYYKDPTDPRFASDKEVERFRQTMAKYAPNADAFDINYITGYNQGALLEQMLKQCKDELSRENIVRQARSIQNFRLPMAIPGIVVNTGDTNSQAITQLQLQRWDGKSWQLFGGVIGAARD